MSWNLKLKLPIHRKIHQWKNFLSRTLYCKNFARLQFSEVEDQLLKMRMFQMTWNSKLKLPIYIKGHPWKKIGGQTPFLHGNLHICNFQCCQIQSAITQNESPTISENSIVELKGSTLTPELPCKPKKKFFHTQHILCLFSTKIQCNNMNFKLVWLTCLKTTHHWQSWPSEWWNFVGFRNI